MILELIFGMFIGFILGFYFTLTWIAISGGSILNKIDTKEYELWKKQVIITKRYAK